MLVMMAGTVGLADLTLLCSTKHLCQLADHGLGEVAHGPIDATGSTVVEVDAHSCIALTLAYKLAAA